jgi:AcrR family transcriptional regulator
MRHVTVDEIASVAGVGKQTIYRWWPSKTSVVLDALVETADAELPFTDSGDTQDDIRLEMRRLARFFASDRGVLIREIVGAAASDPTIGADFRSRFNAHRRQQAATVLTRGIERGELRDDIDIDVTIDVLYGLFWVRLMVLDTTVTHRMIDEILAITWPGLLPR